MGLCIIEDVTSFLIEGHGGHGRVRGNTATLCLGKKLPLHLFIFVISLSDVILIQFC